MDKFDVDKFDFIVGLFDMERKHNNENPTGFDIVHGNRPFHFLDTVHLTHRTLIFLFGSDTCP